LNSVSFLSIWAYVRFTRWRVYCAHLWWCQVAAISSSLACYLSLTTLLVNPEAVALTNHIRTRNIEIHAVVVFWIQIIILSIAVSVCRGHTIRSLILSQFLLYLGILLILKKSLDNCGFSSALLTYNEQFLTSLHFIWFYVDFRK